MTHSQALALYERACATHARKDWRLACHALAEVVRALPASKPEPMREAYAAPAPDMPKDKRVSLLEFLSLRGVRDPGKELEVRDVHRWHRLAPFRRRIVRDDGMDMEAAALLAWEHGYFPDISETSMESGENMHPVDRERFLSAIDRELSGRPVYPWEYDIGAPYVEPCPADHDPIWGEAFPELAVA
ncbi:hypothetical protein IWC96_14495 [Brevundimonas sp. BAL450]|uniref:hypothetical protein n=1 Tax=Brevundimonas sp. BAL450 TaxID=1708162 RepID=UPI0018C981D7|nr:hypothetical protein [Brevundimonas sp. BAL450]MBG7616484.1 hypothetical protein [Brevundimonas sp. BAL450]